MVTEFCSGCPRGNFCSPLKRHPKKWGAILKVSFLMAKNPEIASAFNKAVLLQIMCLAPRAEQNLLLQYLTKLKSTLNCLYASVKRPKWVSTHEDHCAELNIANSNPISENTLPLISLSQYISINTMNTILSKSVDATTYIP